MGKQQFQRGSNGNEAGRILTTQYLEGKRIFLAGHPFTLAGQRFSGVVTGGRGYFRAVAQELSRVEDL